MTFRDQLWARMLPGYQEVLAHPFLTGLTDGSLPRTVFEHYVVQDSHYLRDYARALALCAAKAPDEQTTAMFADHARGCIAVERLMHTEFLDHLGVKEAGDRQPVLPTTSTTTLSERTWLP